MQRASAQKMARPRIGIPVSTVKLQSAFHTSALRFRARAKRCEEYRPSRRRRRGTNTRVRLLRPQEQRLVRLERCVTPRSMDCVSHPLRVSQPQENDSHGPISVLPVPPVIPEEGLQFVCECYPRHLIPMPPN